jgi:hypothetical protein
VKEREREREVDLLLPASDVAETSRRGKIIVADLGSTHFRFHISNNSGAVG